MNNDLSEKLGARIRYFRSVARLSQGDLAHNSMLTNGYLSDVERGKVNISILNLNQVAQALGVSLSVLLDFEDDKRREQVLAAIEEKLHHVPDDVLQGLYRVMSAMAREEEPETPARP